ncbi:RNA polymerase sigma factor [Elongatibacter sediminis]|uniref:RNA polymerase sigma factor n=1 Tax=Elongatibacter sediminis TaxID=3119006 RepID=A0AAW9RE51_9GAMM
MPDPQASEHARPGHDASYDPGRQDDLEAVEQILAGEETAYAQIMRRHNQRMFRAARSILSDDDVAQDAVQEAYIKAFYRLESYRPTGSFAAWLTRIAVNEALMIKRKNPHYQAHGENEPEAAGHPVPSAAATRADPADRAANIELAGLIERAIDRLPLEFRTVFVLRAIQQLSVRETAESVGINEATVKTRLHRARKLMKEVLDRHIADAGLGVYEFAGRRCDRMVATVLARLAARHQSPGR